MREVYIDASKKQLKTEFAGYAGEHNESKLIVKLPSNMVNSTYSYKFVFGTSYGEKYERIPNSNDGNGIVSCMLEADYMRRGTLEAQVEAYTTETDSSTSEVVYTLIAKTDVIKLIVKGSVEGQETETEDISASKAEELQQYVDKQDDATLATAKSYTDTVADNKADKDYVSNAIKGNGTGTALLFDDVSPISHKVGLSGTAGASVNVYGKNLSEVNTILSTQIGNMYLSKNIMPNQIYTFSAIWASNVEDHNKRMMINFKNKPGGTQYKSALWENLTVGQRISCRITVTDTTLYMNPAWMGNELQEIQLEVGNTATDYEPYKTTQTITLDENGKGEADSVSPNMTVVSDSEVEVEYNRDINGVLDDFDKNVDKKIENKADISELNTVTQRLENELNTKADMASTENRFDALESGKADKDYVDEINGRLGTAEENKADTSYVNEQDLALGQRIDELQENKAEQAQVDNIAEGLTNKTAYSLGVAGLYNESNELIKSWDELIADGDITVVDNAITGNNLTNSGKLIIDSSITSIGERAFVDATVTDIVIPNSVTSIGTAGFEWCDSLINITIPDSITIINNYTFSSCTSLTSITIPDSVTSIGQNAFVNCTSLINVKLSHNLTSIELSAFPYCSNLKSLEIPKGITVISGSTFEGCSSLESITIPNSVTSIEYGAFIDCDSLTDVYFKGTKTQWNSIAIGADNTPLTNATIHYELTNEVYNALNNRADKTSNTKDHNIFISDLNYTGSTAERIAFTESSKYIKTGVSVGTVVSLTSITESIFNYTIIDCNAGDYFYVNASGGNLARAWAFIDKDNKLLSKSNENIEYHGELKAPTKAKKLIVNTQCKEFYCYKGRTLKNRIAANETEITSIKNIYATKSDVSSGYLSNDKYPVVKGTKQVTSDTPILINDISPVSQASKISISSSSSSNPQFYISGRNLLNDNQLPLGTEISGEWTSDFVYCNIPQGTFKLVINELNEIPNGCSISFYDDFQNLLGETQINTDGTFYNGYGFYHDTGYSSYGTCYIKISLVSMYITLDSVMITLPECSNEYIAQQSCGGYLFDSGLEIEYSEIYQYPDTIIVPYAITNNTFTVEYNRDVGGAFNDVENKVDNKVDISNIDNLLSKTSEGIVKNSIVSKALYYLQLALEHSGIYVLDFLSSSNVIPTNTYNSNTNIKELYITDNITDIRPGAFRQCTNLNYIVFGQNIKFIGHRTFWDCSSLTSVKIPASVNDMDLAFYKCIKLSSFIVDSENSVYASVNNVLFNKSKTKLILYPAGITNSTYTIPDTVTSLGAWAFKSARFNTVVIPNTISELDEGVFDSSYLTSVDIPSSVNTIGLYAFSDCPKLALMTLPNSLTSIDSQAFAGCTALTEVTLGSDFNASLNISSGNYTADVMVAMFNSLKDLTGATAKTLTLGSTNLAKLTDEQKAIATNKNWNLA